MLLIKNKSKTYLLLLVLLGSVPAICKKSTFIHNKIKVNTQDLTKEKYSDMTYDDYIGLKKSVIEEPNLVKEHILEDLFSELPPKECGQERCKTSMYEITNFNLGKRHVSSIPTVLLVGGIHGTETLGMQALMRFVQILQKLFKVDSQIYKMLSGSRLLVIPVLNMSGFYKGEDHELVIVNDLEDEADVNFDFNINPRDKCFTSLSSQFIQRIFQENLILGTLALTKGDFTIEAPNLSKLMGTKMSFRDEIFMNQTVTKLYKVFTADKELDVDDMDFFDLEKKEDFPNLTIRNSFSIDMKIDYGEIASGKFIDWALIASHDKTMATTKCLPKESVFTPKQIVPSFISNRAIAIEIGLDKEKLRNLTDTLGNEIGCADMSLGQAEYGLFPALMNAFRKFLQKLNPYLTLNQINVDTDTEADSDAIEFYFGMHGFTNSNPLMLNDKQVLSQEVTVDNGQSQLKSKYIIIKATFPKNHLKTKSNFSFKISVLPKNENLPNQSSEYITHFVKVRKSPEYQEKLGRFYLKIPNFYDFKVLNVNIDSLETSLIYEQFLNFTMLIENTPELIQVGPYFPLGLDYDPKNGLVSHLIKKENVPSNVKENKKEGVAFQTGLIARLNQGKINQSFLDHVSGLNRNLQNLKISFYDGDLPWVCSQIKTDYFTGPQNQKVEDGLDRDEDKPASKNRLLKPISEETDKRGQDFYTNLCGDYNDADKIDDSMKFEMNGHSQLKVLSSIYLNFLANQVRIEFDADDIPTKTNSKANQISPPRKTYQLNGTVVLPDQTTLVKSGSQHLLELAPTKDILQKPSSQFLPFPTNRLVCSSLSPYYPIDSTRLKEASSIIKEKKNNKVPMFYYLSLISSVDDQNIIEVSLFTNNPASTNEYVLNDKNSSFVLQKIIKKDFIENESLLHEYRARFDKSLLMISGLYLMLTEKGKDKIVFDCFPKLGRDKENGDEIFFKLYQGIIKEVNEYIYDDANQKSNYGFSSKIVIISLLVVLCLLMLVFAIILGLKIKTNKKEAVDILDQNTQKHQLEDDHNG